MKIYVDKINVLDMETGRERLLILGAYVKPSDFCHIFDVNFQPTTNENVYFIIQVISNKIVGITNDYNKTKEFIKTYEGGQSIRKQYLIQPVRVDFYPPKLRNEL